MGVIRSPLTIPGMILQVGVLSGGGEHGYLSARDDGHVLMTLGRDS